MNHSKDFKDGGDSNSDGYTRLANDSAGGSSSDASPPKGFAASENSRQNNAIRIFNTQEFTMSSWAWVSTGILYCQMGNSD